MFVGLLKSTQRPAWEMSGIPCLHACSPGW